MYFDVNLGVGIGICPHFPTVKVGDKTCMECHCNKNDGPTGKMYIHCGFEYNKNSTMRFVLRNQQKIKEALGEDNLHRILESLKQGFERYGNTIEKEIETIEGHPYPLLTLNDAEHSFNVIVFYVIRKQYDVYTLAFKEFIG